MTLSTKVTDTTINISLLPVTMGNCLKRKDPGPTSQAMIIKDQMEIISHLSKKLSYQENVLKMVRGQNTVFLLQIKNVNWKIRLLRHELQLLRFKRSSLKPKRIHLTP